MFLVTNDIVSSVIFVFLLAATFLQPVLALLLGPPAKMLMVGAKTGWWEQNKQVTSDRRSIVTE